MPNSQIHEYVSEHLRSRLGRNHDTSILAYRWPHAVYKCQCEKGIIRFCIYVGLHGWTMLQVHVDMPRRGRQLFTGRRCMTRICDDTSKEFLQHGPLGSTASSLVFENKLDCSTLRGEPMHTAA